MRKALFLSVMSAVFTVAAGNLTEKIAAECKVTGRDRFHGFKRTRFEFKGCKAWIVEPSVPASGSMPWTWTMQWATSFVPRTPVLHLLRKGWHHVTIDTFRYKMNDEGIAVSKAFQDFLVKELGFSPKACLVGLSWGGFFSTRYTAADPSRVAAIYYDCPLMNLEKFMSRPPDQVRNAIGPWADSVSGNWTADPRMPVNMAETVAKAGIPVYLVYGAVDAVVPPETNCEMFLSRFKAAGGDIRVEKRNLYAHHPHGLEIDDTSIADFFVEAVSE